MPANAKVYCDSFGGWLMAQMDLAAPAAGPARCRRWEHRVMDAAAARPIAGRCSPIASPLPPTFLRPATTRSEERRVGKEGVRTGSSRWSPYPSKKITHGTHVVTAKHK